MRNQCSSSSVLYTRFYPNYFFSIRTPIFFFFIFSANSKQHWRKNTKSVGIKQHPKSIKHHPNNKSSDGKLNYEYNIEDFFLFLFLSSRVFQSLIVTFLRKSEVLSLTTRKLQLVLLASSRNFTIVHLRKKQRMGNLLCCAQVDQSTVAIKENFGAFHEVLDPGCHCLPWCLGSQIAGHLTLRVQQLNVKCETKTKDNVFVNFAAFVQYRVLPEKVSDAFYRVTNTTGQIEAYVLDGIRTIIPKLPLCDVFNQKNEIAKAVEESVKQSMSTYGYEIVQILIVNTEPDEHVKRVMNEIYAAAEKAEADSHSKYLSGLGTARQCQAIVDGLRGNAGLSGITAKDVMDMALKTQYLDTMKEVVAALRSSAVSIPHWSGAVRDVAT